MNNEKPKAKYTSTFDRTEFGKRIRKARKDQGLSQKDLAQMTAENRDGSYISNFETDKNATTLDGAVDIANSLEVSLDYLCNRDDFINRPITMGDIARSLMILPYLDEVNIQMKYENMENTTKGGNFGKSKEVPTFRIKSGSLRSFFCFYHAKMIRSKPEDFLNWLRGEMKRLDSIPAWDEKNDCEWSNCVKRQIERGFPENILRSLIWNHGADYGIDLNASDAEPFSGNDNNINK